jgi:hypothetical protein
MAPCNSSGHEPYCQQKIWQWEEFACVTDIKFKSANPDFPATWKPLV